MKGRRGAKIVAKPRRGKIKPFTDKRGEFRFNFVAANGQVVAMSEGYKTKASCRKGIRAAIKIAIDGVVEFFPS